MSKEFERDLLYNYLREIIELKKGLPVKDEVVCTTYQENMISSWTFKGLIKEIYDLEDKK